MAKINWKEKQPPKETELTEMAYMMLAIAELDAQREMDKIESEIAIAKLAEAQAQKEQAVKIPEDHGTLMAELAELKQRVSMLEALLADK